MGYDLYGLSPQKNESEPLQLTKLKSKFEKDGWMQFDKMSPKQKENYFELCDEVENKNPGRYFRNNVWWWRPLWDFVSEQCQDFLTVEDIVGGGSNSGHKISKTKSLMISRRLSKVISEGLVDKIDREMTLKVAQAKADNEELQKEMDKVTNKCHKEHGKNLVPANYPEPYYSQWKELQGKHNWDGDYPFNADNVKEFAKFCQESGGFEIC